MKESESNKSFIKVNSMSIQEENYTVNTNLNESVLQNKKKQAPIVVPSSHQKNYINPGSKENSNIRSNLQEGPSKAYGNSKGS